MDKNTHSIPLLDVQLICNDFAVHQSLLTEKKKPAGDFEFKQIIDSIADCSCLCVRSLVDIYESWVGNFEALQFRKSWQQSFDFGASISKNKVGSKT